MALNLKGPLRLPSPSQQLQELSLSREEEKQPSLKKPKQPTQSDLSQRAKKPKRPKQRK